MAMKVDNIKLNEKQERRIKLTSYDKEKIVEMYQTGLYSLRNLAFKYRVSKKKILLIVNPLSKEKNDKRIKEHWKDYQDREKLTITERELRRYKKMLLEKGELGNENL